MMALPKVYDSWRLLFPLWACLFPPVKYGHWSVFPQFPVCPGVCDVPLSPRPRLGGGQLVDLGSVSSQTYLPSVCVHVPTFLSSHKDTNH